MLISSYGDGAGLLTPAGPPSVGLQVWLKADAGITIATGVSNWADQSGNGNNFAQATGANQPAFVASAINGLPALSFTGGAMMDCSTLSIAGAKHVFMVRKITPDPGAAAFAVPWNIQGGVSGYTGVNYTGSGSGYQPTSWRADVSGSGVGAGCATALDTAWHTEALSYNGAGNTTPGNYTFSLDGTSLTVVVDAAYGARSGQTVSRLGADVGNSNGAGSFFQGAIAEFFAYNRVLSGADLATIQSYFLRRYGIA